MGMMTRMTSQFEKTRKVRRKWLGGGASSGGGGVSMSASDLIMAVSGWVGELDD